MNSPMPKILSPHIQDQIPMDYVYTQMKRPTHHIRHSVDTIIV